MSNRYLNFCIAFFLVVSKCCFAGGKTCKLSVVTLDRLSGIDRMMPGDFSHDTNKALQKTGEFLLEVDKKTLGLLSALTLKRFSIRQLTPTQWNTVLFAGTAFYSPDKLTMIPAKGIQLSLSHRKRKINFWAGVNGEFQTSLYELVPYTDIKLFPYIGMESGHAKKPIFKDKIALKFIGETRSCAIEMNEIPIRPAVIVIE